MLFGAPAWLKNSLARDSYTRANLGLAGGGFGFCFLTAAAEQRHGCQASCENQGAANGGYGEIGFHAKRTGFTSSPQFRNGNPASTTMLARAYGSPKNTESDEAATLPDPMQCGFSVRGSQG